MKKRGSERQQVWLRGLGRKVRDAREDLRISYRDLAAAAGVSPSQILRMESGEFDVSVTNFIKVARTLRLTIGLIAESVVAEPVWSEVKEAAERDRDLQLAASPENTKAFSHRLECLEHLVSVLASAVIEVTLSSNPQDMARRLSFEFAPVQAALMEFAARVDVSTTSTEERAALINSIIEQPYAKLRALGILTDDLVNGYMQRCKTKVFSLLPLLQWPGDLPALRKKK